MADGDAVGGSQHQSNRVFGGGLGVASGRVQYGDAPGAGGGEINVDRVGAGAGDQLQLGQLLDDGGVDDFVANQQNVGVLRQERQFLRQQAHTAQTPAAAADRASAPQAARAVRV